ncbi:MAG: B12-binding domain-containing radical SAM protein [Gracilibacteraceae bacterium]|nr:B12-binding domain-containing radical SAM protein [Gracilibacteraceae bacterium]
MKIALIKPTIGTKSGSLYVDEGRMEPLQLGLIASLIPPGDDVVLYDDRMEQIPFDDPADAVMITTETFTAKRAYEIAAEYAKRKVPVIMGGMHAKLSPEEMAEHCDSLIAGDAENILPQVLEDLKNGALRPVYDCGVADPPQNGSVTRRDIFAGKGYLPVSLLQFSRGCVHGCKYCAGSVYFDKRHYCRRVEDVIAEIKSQKRKLLFFVDDNLIANPEKAKELFRALIPLKINWVSQGTVSMVYDNELMDLIVKSGGLGFVIGFESINPDAISLMGKDVNIKGGAGKYKTEIELLRQWGLQTWAAFTLGHDTDTVESIKQTAEWAIRNKFTFAAFNILMPYPKTPLYEKLAAEGRLLYDGKWWLHDEYRFNHASFLPKNMTPDELTEAAFYCRKKFNSLTAAAYRMFEPQTNMRTLKKLITYWLYNPLFRKEVFKKQGLRLGLKHFGQNGRGCD